MGVLPKAAPCLPHQLDQAESPRQRWLPTMEKPLPARAVHGLSPSGTNISATPPVPPKQGTSQEQELCSKGPGGKGWGSGSLSELAPAEAEAGRPGPSGTEPAPLRTPWLQQRAVVCKRTHGSSLSGRSGELGREHGWFSRGTRDLFLFAVAGNQLCLWATHVLRAPWTCHAPGVSHLTSALPSCTEGCGTCPKGSEQRSPGDTRLSAPTVLPCTRPLSSSLHPPATA